VRARGEGGFTLVEVMVALMIVATTCAILQSVSSKTMRSAIETNHLRVAKMLLRAKAEEIAAGAEQSAGGTFDEQGFRGYSWSMMQQALQADDDEVVLQVDLIVRYPTRSSDTLADASVDPTSGDGPGRVHVSLFLDPPDAKLEPPQQ
jgi:type II secretion system protein I